MFDNFLTFLALSSLLILCVDTWSLWFTSFLSRSNRWGWFERVGICGGYLFLRYGLIRCFTIECWHLSIRINISTCRQEVHQIQVSLLIAQWVGGRLELFRCPFVYIRQFHANLQWINFGQLLIFFTLNILSINGRGNVCFW